MRGKFVYPESLLNVCVKEEDRQQLIQGIKKTGDIISVKCIQCNREYAVRIHDIYRKKINKNDLLKPLLCRSCVHKNNPSGIVKKLKEGKEGDYNGRRD